MDGPIPDGAGSEAEAWCLFYCGQGCYHQSESSRLLFVVIEADLLVFDCCPWKKQKENYVFYKALEKLLGWI